MTSKRTRALFTKQSKYGCFTCKARRIKCDEGKPSCQRCSRANRICEGYPDGAPIEERTPSSSNSSTLTRDSSLAPTSPHYALSDRVQCSASQSNFAELGAALLGSHPYLIPNAIATAFWTRLLPQLSHSIPSVNAALATFGIYFETQVVQGIHPTTVSLCTQQYDTALKYLQHDLKTLPYGPLPLLTSCILLAAAQTASRSYDDALVHVGGASQILSMQNASHKPTSNNTSLQTASASDESQNDVDGLIAVFQSLDVHIATYSPRSKLAIPVLHSLAPLPRFTDVALANTHLVKIMHASYHFLDKGVEQKFKPRNNITSTLSLEQGYHISRLRLWLKQFEEDIDMRQDHLSNIDCVPSQNTQQANILKAQCLSTLIEISTVLDFRQTSADVFHSEFEQIIECAEIALAGQKSCGSNSSHRSRPLYSVVPGIIQPLFLTAWQYRCSTARRKAIKLLRIAGIEGPWDGVIEAVLASKIVEIEEERPLELDSESLNLIAPSDVPNNKRVCFFYWISHYGSDTENIQEAFLKFFRYPVLEDELSEEVDLHGENCLEVLEERLTYSRE